MSRTLDSLTVGQLRQLVNYGGSEADTIAEALAKITQADQATAEHAVSWRAFQAYVGRREQHRRDALEEAAQQAQEATRGKSDSARMTARQAARQDAHDDFEQSQPLLDFPAWQVAGEPATHTVNAIKRAAATVKELVS